MKQKKLLWTIYYNEFVRLATQNLRTASEADWIYTLKWIQHP